MKDRIFQRLVFNFAGKVRRETLEGREHVVVPGVMMAEGVWSGSKGAVFYPADELQRCCPSWNHKPLVVYHPKDSEGNDISGCLPHVLNTRKVGVLLNVKFEDGQQKGEAWIDEERCKEVDSRILDAVEAGKPVELSTGLYAEAKRYTNKRKHGDKSYNLEAVNHQPDHLAILPDQIGAFSVEDGGGLRTNQVLLANLATEPERNQEAMTRSVEFLLSRVGAELVDNELSFSDTMTQLNDLLAAKYGEPGKYWRGYVCDVFKTYVIFKPVDSYPAGPEMLQKYTVANDVVSLVGDATEVRRKVQYVAASAVFEAGDEDLVANGEETNMDRKTHIDALIANGTFADGDRARLDALPDEFLFKIKGKAPAPTTNAGGDPPAPQGGTPAPQTNQTVDQFLASAPPAIRSVLANALATEAAAKAKLIDKIMAHPKNVFEKAALEAAPISNLQAIAVLIPDAPTYPTHEDYSPLVGAGAHPVANFAGAAGAPTPTTNGQEQHPPQRFLPTPGRKPLAAANGAAK